MRKILLITFSAFVLSCGGAIKDVSFETGDYLETGYDEKPQEKIGLSKPNKENTTSNTEKKSFLSTLANAVATDTEDEEMSDIYEKTTTKPIEEVELTIQTLLENKNFKIVHIIHVSKGLEEQGEKNFWKNMNIYLVCKLSKCSVILKNNPQLASQFPLKVYIYEKDGKIVVGTYKPSTFIRYMGNLDVEAIKVLKELDLEIKEIIDEVVK